MPALFAGAQSSNDDHHARVITTASSAAYLYTLNWGTFKDGPERQKMSTGNLYNQSKFVSPRSTMCKDGRHIIV